MWVSLQLRLSDASHCGGDSAGGASSPEAYVGWIRAVAAAIGTADAVVIVEPDTLALLCGDPAQRVRMLQDAVDALEANRGTRTYLDAGHSDWIAPQVMAERLRAAGVDEADGFALNVSNFPTTADNVAYGRCGVRRAGRRALRRRHWPQRQRSWQRLVQPPGRALGERPTADTGQALVDAYLWVKTPGESEGTCNGGPAAGAFWPEYALGLARG